MSKQNKPLEFFKPEDFGTGNNQQKESAAFYANMKLQAALGPVVYGEADTGTQCFSPHKGFSDTHQAHLFNVQPIQKKECKHEREAKMVLGYPDKSFCRFCGIELVAKWEAK